MLRGIWLGLVCVVLGGVVPAMGRAQTHAVKKPDAVVRAVAVYEWTGDADKPKASRVVPVSVFIDGHLEDGAVYLARPVPFELDTGTVFEVEKAGVPEGSLDLSYTRHYVSNGIAAFDDGWLGYGPFKPASKPVLVAAKKSGPLPQVVTSGGPHFSNGTAASGTSTDKGASQPVDRSSAAGGGTTVSADKDPDAPTMRRRNTDASGSSDSASTDTDSSKDVDRPTLKRRTPAEQKAAQKKKDLASVSGSSSLNDDPDRPNLHRGKPASRLDEEDLPPLKGMPTDLQQAVAVSDAKDRPEHPFERMWENDEERTQVTASLEDMARTQLAKYDLPAASAVVGTSAPAPVAKDPGRTSAPTTAAARARQRRAAAAAKAAAATAAAAAPVMLKNPSVKAYTLSYGGAATYVYTAVSPGAGGVDRYVSVVAQREPVGSLKMALASVTDANHLDRTPWMRLVDAVDAEASNRASLLFELRAQSSRQFALYRVIGAATEQTFVTGIPE